MDIIADFAVMGDMAAIHKHIVIADGSGGTGSSTGVNGSAFTENIVISDIEISRFSGHNGVILGRLTESRKRMQNVVFAYGGITIHAALGDQAATVADFNISANETKGTDFHSVTENGTVFYDCTGMDLCHKKYSLLWWYSNSYYNNIISIRLFGKEKLVKTLMKCYFIRHEQNN
jgi:hypothetical protein